jgi:hypothetical protein
MRNLFATVSSWALACSIAIAPALAQQETAAVPGSQQVDDQVTMGSGNAGDLTCAHLNSIDAAEIPGLLYFIQGFDEGRSSGNAQSGSGASSGARSGASFETASTSDTTASPTPAGSESGSGSATASGANEGAEAGSETATAASDSSSAEQDPAPGTEGASAPMTTASEGGAGNDPGGLPAAREETQAASVAGFFRIPIEQTVVACAENPDSTVADVIRQQGTDTGESSGG